MLNSRRWFCVVLMVVLPASHLLGANGPAADPLAEGLRPFLDALGGRQTQFSLSGAIKLPIDGEEQSVSIQLVRFGDEAFDLALTHSEYAVSIRRCPCTKLSSLDAAPWNLPTL